MTMETSNPSNPNARPRTWVFIGMYVCWRVFFFFFSPLLWNIYKQKVHRVNESYVRLLWNSLNEFHLIVYTSIPFSILIWCVCVFSNLVQRALAPMHLFIFYINTWNVLNLIQMIISRSFMCSTMSDHSKKKKKNGPNNTVAFDIFEMLFNRKVRTRMDE